MAKGSRRRRIASAARSAGRWSVQGAKGSLAATGAGVVTYVGLKELSKRVETVQKHPIAAPLALVVGGHFLKRKYQSLGAGMIGAGAALTALAFDLNRQGVANKVAGNEAQALTPPGDIRALTPPGDIRDLDSVIEEVTGPEEDSGVYDMSSAMSLGT
jgi:hypothetical protein